MERIAVRLGQVLVGLAVLLWVADFGTMRVRLSRGTAFSTVTVHQLVATPLKGQKEEYDFLGDAVVTCSRSIFPQSGKDPCWWVARHTTVWE